MRAVMLLVPLAACGGDDAGSHSAEPTTPDPTSCEPPSAAVACAAAGAVCGELEAADSCGDPATVDCGGCTTGECGFYAPNQCDSAASCTDGAQNGDETDVDCGGSCPACGVGAVCGDTTDCAGATCEDDRCADGVWARMQDLPTARAELAATWAQGRLYAIGGFTDDHGAVRDVEAYDPSVPGWTTVASLPLALYGHAAVTGADGRIYVVGGPYTGPQCRVALVYDPAIDDWQLLGSMVDCRFHGGLVVDGGGLLRAVAGFSASGSLDTTEVYDPVADAWTRDGPRLSDPRSSFGLAVVDTRTFVFGGSNLQGTLDSVELSNPTGAWFTPPTTMPQAREDLAAAASGGRVYLFGALDAAGTGRSRVVDAYDEQAVTWSVAASMPTPRRGAAAATAPDGAIWVVGGWREEVAFAQDTAAVERFTPTP